MTDRHFYFVFENLDLSGSDWDDFVQKIKQRGSNNDPQPANRNHWRYRLDNQAIIFEALFNEAAVIEQAVIGVLTSVTQVPPPRIDYAMVEGISTYTIDGVDSLIQQVFGSNDATWEESRQDVLSYLSANQDAWEEEEI